MLPLELAQALAHLDKAGEWRALLAYLALREGQLNNSLSLCRPDDSERVIANTAMIAKGGKTEIENLRNLPELARRICSTEAAKAEAKSRK